MLLIANDFGQLGGRRCFDLRMFVVASFVLHYVAAPRAVPTEAAFSDFVLFPIRARPDEPAAHALHPRLTFGLFAFPLLRGQLIEGNQVHDCLTFGSVMYVHISSVSCTTG